MRSDPPVFANSANNDYDSNPNQNPNQNLDQNSELNMAILTLSPLQQQIINWVMRHRGATLELIANGLEDDISNISVQIEDLINQGLLETRQEQGLTYYEIDFRRQQASDLEMIESMASAAVALRPLSIILNPSGTVSVTTGESFELCVTVTNQGDRSAVISVAIDQDASSIYSWCASPSERLALNIGQSCEVVFAIQVPPTTPPEEYNYTLIIDAPQHYPEDTPVQYKGKVIVLPLVQEVIRVNDPTFATLPRTSSNNPHPMRAGEIWQIIISVSNRSERVDRFRVTVPDLDPKWISIYYPEGLALVGIIEASEGLALNPGMIGQVTLIVKPPINTWAGVYAPTIRVHSANNPDLSLLDIAYFEILPIYQIDIQITTLLGRTDRRSSLYELRLVSASNIARELRLSAGSPEQGDLLGFQLDPQDLTLAPYSRARVLIEVEPDKRCKPNFLSDRYLNFIVEVEDKQDVLIPNNRHLGSIVIPSRPWWQFVLLLLGILGIIGLVIFLIWWFFFRPPDVPQVLEFSSESPTYREAANEAVRLRWRVNNPQLLREITVEGRSADDTVISQPVTYKFDNGIPAELKEYCVIESEMLCQNVPTDARKPSQYIFHMNLTTKNRKTSNLATSKTTKITVEPIPQGQILEFAATKPSYTEARPILPSAAPSAIPSAVNTASNDSSNANTASAATPPAATPINSPRFFLGKESLLVALGININGFRSGIPAPKPDLDQEVRLNWKLNNISQVREITLVGRSPNGEIKSPPLTFLLTEGMPRSLSPYCFVSEDTMTCKSVPTEAIASGSYVFELTLAPLRPPADPKALPITQKTEVIKIAPFPAKILELKVNGQDALPLYSFNLNPAIPTTLALSWRIEASKSAKIELLPSPGDITPVGQLSLPLAPKSAEVTYTLKVTNPDGQTVMRSFVIQTIAPPLAPETKDAEAEAVPPIALPPEIPEVDSPLIPNVPIAPDQPSRSGGSLSPSEAPPTQK